MGRARREQKRSTYLPSPIVTTAYNLPPCTVDYWWWLFGWTVTWCADKKNISNGVACHLNKLFFNIFGHEHWFVCGDIGNRGTDILFQTSWLCMVSFWKTFVGCFLGAFGWRLAITCYSFYDDNHSIILMPDWFYSSSFYFISCIHFIIISV